MAPVTSPSAEDKYTVGGDSSSYTASGPNTFSIVCSRSTTQLSWFTVGYCGDSWKGVYDVIHTLPAITTSL